MTVALGRFENSFARLPSDFHARLQPTPVAAPKLLAFNRPLAQSLGLQVDVLDDVQLAAIFSGNVVPQGADPLAAAYAGHQFGSFVPQLGDGRALLLGEVRALNGAFYDIQLKGAGPTPFSRRGDGRAALGPVLREYLVSEAMHTLGVPTTRALAAVATGERVYRDTILPGAVLTRVASSHVRVGSFEYHAARRDDAALKTLVDFVIARHDPEAARATNSALALLEGVIHRQANLIATWMGLGFVHGVMNTDNMALSGETIDYGPCAFMDHYDPATVFSSIDQWGRYAYEKQPAIAQWNLARLAEALLPLIDADEDRAVQRASEAISKFAMLYRAAYHDVMRAKLGLVRDEEGDEAILDGFLDILARNKADFTLAFRRLAEVQEGDDAPLLSVIGEDTGALAWVERYKARGMRESQSPQVRASLLRAVNPIYIPRNHHVEAVLQAAIVKNDLAPFERLFTVLQRPYEERPDDSDYATSPVSRETPYRTFCGT
jgi:serine/tyrosine/threonine adenylyltransferase